MQASITLNDLGLIVLFAVFVAAGGYAVIAFRNISIAAREITDFVVRHKKDFNKSIPAIAETAENAAAMSKDLRNGMGAAGRALETISQDTTDTVLRVNETADQVATYVMVIGEVAKAILDMLSSKRRG